MRMKWVGFVVLALVLVPVVWAFKGGEAVYEEGDVTDGGTIAGAIKFMGTPPPPSLLEVTKDLEACGKEPIMDESLVVGEDGSVRWAVVSLTDVQSGKKWDLPEAVLDQNGCTYRPHVLLVRAGENVNALNNDGVLHNIHTFPEKNAPLNKAHPRFLKPPRKLVLKGKSFRTPETINVRCDVHPWMNAYIVAAAHPYFAVTDKGGQFTLANVPPGTYTLEVWQESLGKASQQVTVKPNETTTLTVALEGK